MQGTHLLRQSPDQVFVLSCYPVQRRRHIALRYLLNHVLEVAKVMTCLGPSRQHDVHLFTHQKVKISPQVTEQNRYTQTKKHMIEPPCSFKYAKKLQEQKSKNSPR